MNTYKIEPRTAVDLACLFSVGSKAGSGPVSAARDVKAHKPPARFPPGGPPEGKKMAYDREHMPENQVPGTKVCLNASRTSKRRISGSE